MHHMYFDVREIFKSTRIALSLQRIWIQLIGLIVGSIGYLIVTYVSLAVAGINLSVAWKKYGLLPCLFSEKGNWYSYAVYFIAVLWLVIVYLITSTAVSRATYMMVKKNYFYTWRDSYRFAIKKSGSVILSPIAISILIALFLAGGAVVGLVGKIPFIGEYGLVLFTILWFIAALLVIFFIIVLGISLIQVPAIIATTDDDAFEAVFQSFSIAWSQPWRFVLYEAVSVFMAVVGFLVMAILSKKAFLLMDRLFSNTMGNDFINITSHGMYLLSVWVSHSIDWINSLFGDLSNTFYFTKEFDPLKMAGHLYGASYIFAISMLLIGLIIVSYGLAALNVGNTLTYLILRKKKDDENLLEREDDEEKEDEEEEQANGVDVEENSDKSIDDEVQTDEESDASKDES